MDKGLNTYMIETMMEIPIWEYCMGYPSPKHEENEDKEDYEEL